MDSSGDDGINPTGGTPSSLTVDEMVRNARGNTITAARLTELSPGFVGSFRLHDHPLVAYLADGEQPHFIFGGAMSSVKRNGSEVLEPHRGHLVLCFTDRRILVVAGRSDGDKSMELPYGELEHAVIDVGIMKAKITLKDIHNYSYSLPCPANDRSDLEELKSFLPNRIEATEPPTEDGQTGSSAPTEPSVTEWIEDAVSDTVTPERLQEKIVPGDQGYELNDQPVADYLSEEESPHFIVHHDSKSVEKDGMVFLDSEEEYSLVACFTERRVGLIAGQNGSDATAQVTYADVEDWNIEINTMATASLTEEVGSSRVILHTGEDEYTIPIDEAYQPYLDDLWGFLTEKIDIEFADDSEPLLHYRDDDRYSGRVRLEIPTRETGEREGVHRETWGRKQRVETEEKDYVVTVHELRITESDVYFEADAYDAGTETVRRSYEQIDAIDYKQIEDRGGIVLHIRNTIYEFDIEPSTAHRRKVKYTVERMRELLSESSGADDTSAETAAADADQTDTTEDDTETRRNDRAVEESEDGTESDTTETEDPIEKVRRLGELKDEGLLSEEEFEQKKRELLDEI
jgi:hypothetical protein